LNLLLDAGSARIWFHGHSTPQTEIVNAGPGGRTRVVPLGEIAFPDRGLETNEPGRHGWATVSFGADSDIAINRAVPTCLRDFRRNKWTLTAEGLMICPPLAKTGRLGGIERDL
jgi:hypothetical protein